MGNQDDDLRNYSADEAIDYHEGACPPMTDNPTPEALRIAEDEMLLRKIGAILDHPSLYMGGPSRQSMQKARAILPIITDAMEARDARIAELEAIIAAYEKDV